MYLFVGRIKKGCQNDGIPNITLFFYLLLRVLMVEVKNLSNSSLLNIHYHLVDYLAPPLCVVFAL